MEGDDDFDEDGADDDNTLSGIKKFIQITRYLKKNKFIKKSVCANKSFMFIRTKCLVMMLPHLILPSFYLFLKSRPAILDFE